MEIVINNNGVHIPATVEVVNGVMIVSPDKDKVDISQFKDGDIITCGWNGKKTSYSWTCILRGEIEQIADNMFITDYCMVDNYGVYSCENGGSDSATWVRYATEEEKQKLFDALAKEGKAWDAEKKAVVELKWNPKVGELYYIAWFVCGKFQTESFHWRSDVADKDNYKNWHIFKNEQACDEFCEKLNKAIMEVMP